MKQIRQEQLQSEKNDLDKVKSDISNNNITRVFEISSFGIYNCDFPGYFKNPVSISVKLTDKAGNPIVFQLAYLVDVNRKFMHLYPRLVSGSKITYDPDEHTVLFGLMPDNRIAVFNSENFAKLDVHQVNDYDRVTLAMDIPDKKFNTIYDLKDFITTNSKNDNLP